MYRRYYPLVLLLPILTGCQKTAPRKASASTEPPAVQAAVLRVEAKPFSATIAVTGSLISRASVEVKAETTGRILKFPKEEGDRVTAGEPVIWVDEENHRLNARQAESAVKVAEAALARARVAEMHSHSEFERAQNLLKSGGITDKDYKSAELAGQDARAQTELVSAQLDQARSAFESARKAAARRGRSRTGLGRDSEEAGASRAPMWSPLPRCSRWWTTGGSSSKARCRARTSRPYAPARKSPSR